MSVLFSLIYRFSTIPIKIPTIFFVDTDKTDSKVYVETAKTQNSQYNIKGEM